MDKGSAAFQGRKRSKAPRKSKNMVAKWIYILYIKFENEEMASIFHVFMNKEDGEEMKIRMEEHAKKHGLKEEFYLVEYEMVY